MKYKEYRIEYTHGAFPIPASVTMVDDLKDSEATLEDRIIFCLKTQKDQKDIVLKHVYELKEVDPKTITR